MEALAIAAAAALGGLFTGYLADRFPGLTRVMTYIGSGLILAAVVWFTLETPWFALITVAALALGNLALGFSATASRLRIKPPREHDLTVWIEEMELLSALGWSHRGTWVVDMGQSSPAMTVFERSNDGTRVEVMGTAPQGGVITIETLLDEGRGLMTTMRRSASLRPPWMFRQQMKGATLEELLKAHDDALFYLRIRGITPGWTVPSTSTAAPSGSYGSTSNDGGGCGPSDRSPADSGRVPPNATVRASRHRKPTRALCRRHPIGASALLTGRTPLRLGATPKARPGGTVPVLASRIAASRGLVTQERDGARLCGEQRPKTSFGPPIGSRKQFSHRRPKSGS